MSDAPTDLADGVGLPAGGKTDDAEPDPSGTSRAEATTGHGPARFVRLRAARPMLVALVAVWVAGTLAAALAPRWGGSLALVAVAAGVVAALGVHGARTWPGTLAVGVLGGGWCLASGSSPVDVAATSVVAVGLFLAFQVAAGPGAPVWSPVSLTLAAIAASASPVVLLLARGVGDIPPHLYLPAMAAAVTAVVAPVIVVTRRVPRRDPEAEPDL